MNYKSLCFTAITAVLVNATGVFAAFEYASLNSRSKGLSSNIMGPVSNSDCVLQNQSQLAFVSRPEISVSYGKLLNGMSDNTNLNETALTMAYPLTEQYFAGIGYMNTSLSGSYSEETISIAGSVKLSKILSIGLGVKQLTLKYGLDNYSLNDPVFAQRASVTGMDIDASAALSISDAMGLVLSKSDLINTDMGISSEYKLDSVDSLGLYYFENDFLFSSELRNTAGKNGISCGIEKTVARGMVSLRGSVKVFDGSLRNVNAGFGIKVMKLRLDYSMEYPINFMETISGSHFLTTTFYFDMPVKKQKSANKALTKKAAPLEPQAVSQMPPETARQSVAENLTVSKLEINTAGSAPTVISTAPAANVERPKNNKAPLPALISLEIMNSPYSYAVKEISFEVLITTDPAAVSGCAATANKNLNVTGPVKRNTPEASLKTSKPEISYTPATDVRPAKKQNDPRLYKVKEGDTLPELAERYYNDKNKWQKIYDANKDKIEKGYLKQGEIIKIPEK